MLPEAVEAGDCRFAGRQRVALHFHVEKELRDDANQRAPQQHQPDLRGDERPQHELSGRQTHSSRDDSRSDEPPVVARRLRHVANLRAAGRSSSRSRRWHRFIRCCHRASERRAPPRFDRHRRRTRPTCRRSRAAAPPRGGCRRAVARGARARDGGGRSRSSVSARRPDRGHAVRAHEIDGAGERVAIDHDLDEVVVPNAPDGSVVQRLGPDVADAGAAREPGEPAVGDERPRVCPRASNGAQW